MNLHHIVPFINLDRPITKNYFKTVYPLSLNYSRQIVSLLQACAPVMWPSVSFHDIILAKVKLSFEKQQVHFSASA
jgi:hypothetical protein